jgi:hypothetical protein
VVSRESGAVTGWRQGPFCQLASHSWLRFGKHHANSKVRCLTGGRLAPEVVTARTALLERCLAELLAAPPPAAAAEGGQPPQGGQPLRAAPAFLAFLQPRPAAAATAAAKPAWKSPLRE